MDSNMVKERILGVHGILWGEEEDTGQSLKHGQQATVLRWLSATRKPPGWMSH